LKFAPSMADQPAGWSSIRNFSHLLQVAPEEAVVELVERRAERRRVAVEVMVDAAELTLLRGHARNAASR